MERNPQRPPDPESLLREAGWLKRLACGLVGPDSADDVVQSTWLAALEHPPEHPGRLRAWLKRVATNLAMRSLWRENRRPRTESAAARPESLPSTAELVAQMSLQRRIVDEVLALDEPFRSTVVLVFFHDLSAAEVGRRMAIPSSTVRTRLARALERLRERLDADARHGSDWKATLGAFVALGPAVLPVAAGAVAASAGVLGGLVMTLKVKVLTVAALALLAGFLLWRSLSGAEAPRIEDAGAGPAVATERVIEGPSGAASPPPAPAASKPIVPRAFAESSESAPASAPAVLGSLVVKLLWAADKKPATGVPVKFIPWSGQDPFLNQFYLRSDAAGLVRVEGLRPGRFSAISIWGGRSDGSVEAGKELELKVEIPPGPMVEGIVVDSADRPVAGAEVLSGDIGSSDDPQVVATAGADGRFRLPSTTAEMWVLIGARAEGHMASPFVILTGKPGATLSTRLVLGDGGVEVSGRVTDTDGAPVAGVIVQIGNGRDKQFTKPDGGQAQESTTVRTRTDAEGAFRFTGQQPRKTPVFARSTTRFAPWRDEIEIGAGGVKGMRIVLEVGATLAGKVVDTAGAPASGVEVMVGERSWTVEGSNARTRKDGTFRIEGVATGEVVVRADGDEKGKATATLRLVSGQETQWNPVLSTGEGIKGRIVDERGAPLAGSFVEVRTFGTGAFDSKYATSDKDGRFAVTNCAQPKYAVEVRDPKGGSGWIAQVRDVQPGGPELLIQVPDDARATAWITGTVLGPDGKPHPAEVSISRVEEGGSPVITPDPATGVFKHGPIPPGEYRLHVRAAGFPHRALDALRVERDKTLDVGTIRLAPGGDVVVKLEREGGGPVVEPRLRAVADSDKASSHLNVTGSEARSGPLSEGTHVLHVDGKDLVSQKIPFSVRAGETTELKVTLTAGVQIAIRLNDPAGSTESKTARVTIRDSAGAVVFEGETRRYVHYPVLEFRVGLRPGAYKIEGRSADSGRRCSAELTVPPPATDRVLTFALE